MQCNTKQVWLIAEPSYGQIIINEEDFDPQIHTTTKPGKGQSSAAAKDNGKDKPQKNQPGRQAADDEAKDAPADNGAADSEGPTARERAKGMKPVSSTTTEI